MNRQDKLSEHFTLAELIKSETAERKGIDNMPTDALLPKLKRLCVELLEPIRLHYGQPIRPNSSYRGVVLNAKVGGSPKS